MVTEIIFEIILAVIWFYFILKWDVYDDFKRTGDGTIKHTKEAWKRALYLIPSFLCLFLPVFNLQWWEILLRGAVSALLIASAWWEFFDGWLNTLRGKSWRYNGSDDPDDAKSDNFLQKYTPKQQMFIKWGLITLSIILYTLSITIFN